ncbi:MAG TPA: M20/M25/M40 family metallo-hydrolase [Terriglobales bacterium]|nr:M20/M25/M40 family metallo-hydrolase [Terriglobales bacterium]
MNRFLLAVCVAALIPNSPAQIDNSTKQLSHDIFKQLIEINTTDSVGNVTTASQAMAQRFRDAGFPESDIYIGGPNDRKKNVVVRLHGSGKHKPVVLIGHLDVVEAKREDWTTDPFQFVEKDGYFYGRGTQDMKDGDAIMTTTLIRFKKEEYVPDRDIILAMTADEEGGKSNGVDWLLKNKRDLIDAEFVLNHDGGEVQMDHGKALALVVDATEKLYSDYQVITTNPGGHSSLPRPDNAIYELSHALINLEQHKFPFELNSVTRAYYEHLATVETGERKQDIEAILRNPPDMSAVDRLSQDPIDNSRLHTTCVATRLTGGHANNALPGRAEAVVNCRILPGHSKQEVREELVKVFADPKVEVRYITNAGQVLDTIPDERSFAPPPPRPDVFAAIKTVAAKMWSGIPVFPTMATGASDGVYTMNAGLPTYGVSGVETERDDHREHGRDERVPAEAFYKGVDFYYHFLKTLTGSAN